MGGHILEKTSSNTTNESNYDARTNYLNIMKQFMAGADESSQSRRERNIEDYLQYEKEVSQHIQKVLSQST